MIRFVDLRKADIAGGRFAFYDTVRGEFLRICGSVVWDTVAELESDINSESCGAPVFELGGRERLIRLIPQWAMQEVRDE